ncbi:MAG: hypothetical protein DRO93_06260 [Candidatus Thorarchaeota archaeon]|nr:MAG: hypothetical protein DRO93_06260 [Candidatus Thorarchaeota archaeon]
MKLLVTLTPAEGKRLIAKGLLRTEPVRRALRDGYLCVTLGTTSAYLVEEILGEYDKTRHIAGIVIPRGVWVTEAEHRAFDAIFHRGKYIDGKKVIDVLDELGPGDVIIKSANALDVNGLPIVLLASETGGTVGTFLGAVAARNIQLIMPIGLEKCISSSYDEFCGRIGMNEWDYALGVPVGAIAIHKGIPYTEIDALETLFDVRAVPIAAGGVNGAEGCVTLLVEGEADNIKRAYEFLRDEIKGEPLFPEVRHIPESI